MLGFLRYLREDVIRRNLGSEAIADTELQRREGLTLNEYLQREKERRFIAEQVHREIRSRVNVSYRDIKARYERDRDEYEPEPTAVLRLIRVRASDTEARQAVIDALDEGAPVERSPASTAASTAMRMACDAYRSKPAKSRRRSSSRSPSSTSRRES